MQKRKKENTPHESCKDGAGWEIEEWTFPEEVDKPK